MKRFLLFLPAFMFSWFLSAQEPSVPRFQNAISFDLATLVDPLCPRFRFGYFVMQENRVGYSLNVGVGATGLVFPWPRLGEDYQLVEVRPELRYNLYKGRATGLDAGLEGFYIHHRDHFKDGLYYPQNESALFGYDSADFTREKMGFNLKLNLLVTGKRMGVELYGGGGLAWRQVRYRNVEDKVYQEDGQLHFFHYNREGNALYPNITAGIRLFLILGREKKSGSGEGGDAVRND